MGINLGFTGTRDGMSAAQRHKLHRFILRYTVDYEVVYFHHGAGLDRRGGERSADLQAAAIAAELGCTVVPHPPAAQNAEALLARNREVVAASQIMIGCPLEHREQVRSGTWMTIRHARATGREGVIIWPQCGCDTPLGDREHAVD